jgi:hypothetical protein
MKWGRWVLAAVTLAAAATGVGYYGGRLAAQESIERLEVVWPGVMGLGDRDRAALAGSALYCKLNLLPVGSTRVEVFSCLRAGASEILERDPDSDVPSRLEQLIRDASQSDVSPGLGTSLTAVGNDEG